MDRSQSARPAAEPHLYCGSLASIFIDHIPLLDVRAPGEFARGAFPGAINLPLLDDEQRHLVGIRYKQTGQQAAIELGYRLINADVKRLRLDSWLAFLETNPDALLYCFRGGLRSQIVQQWLLDAGVRIPRIQGGYKRLRRFLLDSLQAAIQQHEFLVIAGKTGCGKTHLLAKLAASIDLEGRANHRGSAFGRRLAGQPGQIDFENLLAIDFLKLSVKNCNRIFLEDESRAIGSLSLPQDLAVTMKRAPLAVIEEPLASRVDVILKDYILANYRDYQQQHPDTPFIAFADFLISSLERIRKRLGEVNHRQILELMQRALTMHETLADTSGHRSWIEQLLTLYYDPMYDYQLGKKLDRVVFRGSGNEFLSWAAHLQAAAPDRFSAPASPVDSGAR